MNKGDFPGRVAALVRARADLLAEEPAQSRRVFLRACVRYPLLAGLAVLGGVLAVRQGDPSFAEPCLQQRVCGGCRLFQHCTLPQAVAARKNS